MGFELPHKDLYGAPVLVNHYWATLSSFLDTSRILARLLASTRRLSDSICSSSTKLHIQMAGNSTRLALSALPDSIRLVRGYWSIISDFAEVF